MLYPFTIGREEFFAEGENIVEAKKAAGVYYKEITSRLRNPFKQDAKGNDVLLDDVYLRIRENDDGEFYEWVSPSMNYAHKSMSVAKDSKTGIPYYIGFMQPWIRWNAEDSRNEVLYTAHQLEHGTELSDLGFTIEDANQWVPVERAQVKKKWVWKPAK